MSSGFQRARVLCLFAVAAVACGVARPATFQAGKPQTSGERRIADAFDVIRHDPPALRAFLRAMPKGADLHNHLSGAVYAESYVRWAAGMPLCVDLTTFALSEAESGTCTAPARRPASDALKDPALYRSLVDAFSTRFWHPARTPGHYQFFDSFRKFGAAPREGRETTPDITAQALAEVIGRAAIQKVQHLELMMSFGSSPDDPDGDDLSQAQFSALRDRLLGGRLRERVTERRQWLDAVEQKVRGILRCSAPDPSPGCGLSVRYMPYALRGLPRQAVFAQGLFAFELAAVDPRIAGVNLVMPEDWFIPMRDFELHMQMYAFFREQYPDVNVALHAGELAFGLVPPEHLGRHVRAAVSVAGARRVGHAADVMYDPNPSELLQVMAERRVAVEISLSSSDVILGIRGPRHPLRHFLRAGVPVVIATDDEGIARSDLTNEYQRAVEEHGLSYRDIKEISRNSIEYSFLPPVEKARARERLAALFVEFETTWH